MLLGLGFPRYAGGPLKYCDWLGAAHVLQRCEAYAGISPLYRAGDGLRAMVAAGGRFYPLQISG